MSERAAIRPTVHADIRDHVAYVTIARPEAANTAEFGVDNVVHIEVDVFGLPAAQMELVAAKVRESVSVTHVHWHRT